MGESSVSAEFEPALLSYDALSASPSEISGAFALPLLQRPAASGQPLCINAPSQTLSHLCLSFLALIQHLDVDFLPIGWHSALAGARRGGTAQLHQMAIDCQSAFAFKRLLPLRGEQGEKDWLMLQTEVSVLGQPAVLGCKNIVAIEGLTWHISRETTQPWPVLVFEKAGWGDLMSFVERGPGGEMDLSARLDLCAHVLAAVTVLHETRKLIAFWYQSNRGADLKQILYMGISNPRTFLSLMEMERAANTSLKSRILVIQAFCGTRRRRLSYAERSYGQHQSMRKP